MSKALLLSLLPALDPQSIEENAVTPLLIARESFVLPSPKVGSYQELVNLLTRFVQHLMRAIGLHDFPAELALGRAQQLLKSRGMTLESVHDECRRGIGGGVRKVLEQMTDAVTRDHIDQYIEHAISKRIDQLDYDQLEGLMKAYLEKFAPHLPADRRSMGAIVANWRAIILETARQRSQIRSYVGKYP